MSPLGYSRRGKRVVMSPISTDNEEEVGAEEVGGEMETPRDEAEDDVNGDGGDEGTEGGRGRRRRRSNSGDFRRLWMEGPATEDPLLAKRPCVTCRKSKVGRLPLFSLTITIKVVSLS